MVTEAEVSAYIERAHDGSNMSKPPFERSVYREMLEAGQQQAAQVQAKTAEAAEIKQLRQRVAALERMVIGKDSTLIKAVGTALGRNRREIEALLEAREPVPIPLPVLDQQDRPTMRYCGLWGATKQYRPGDVVTYNGGGWVAQIISTGLKPGDGVGWKLAVKSDTASLRAIVKDEVKKQLDGRR